MSIFEKLGKSVADEFVRKLHEGSVTGLNMTNQVVDGAQSLIDVAADVVNDAAGIVDSYVDYAEDLLSDLSNFLEGFKDDVTEPVQENESKLYGDSPKDGCPSENVPLNINPSDPQNFVSVPSESSFDKAPDVNALRDITNIATYLLTYEELKNFLTEYYSVGRNTINHLTSDFSDNRLREVVRNLRGF